jgi:hypothetical protein
LHCKLLSNNAEEAGAYAGGSHFVKDLELSFTDIFWAVISAHNTSLAELSEAIAAIRNVHHAFAVNVVVPCFDCLAET